MKNKFIMVLVLCAALILPVFGLTACENAGTDKTDTAQESVLPTDNDTKPNENENNDNETDQNKPIVITAETDFDALESDKVSEEEFNKYFYEFYRLMPGVAAGDNLEYGYWAHGFKDNVSIECAVYGDENHNFEYKGSGFIKRDGLKLQVNQNPNNPMETEYYVISDDLKSAYINGEIKDENWIRKNMELVEQNSSLTINYTNYYKFNENKKCYVASFEGTEYESTMLYKGADTQQTLKIKNGRIVYCTLPRVAAHSDGYELMVFKLYDFGTTKIELPFNLPENS